MTLSAAWIRKVGDVEELVMASDSRLRGGEAWDCCPKILTLPRRRLRDRLRGRHMVGVSIDARRWLTQIELHPGSIDRRVDIADLKGHALRVFEQMLGAVTDLPNGQTHPDRPIGTEFLFGGYSWKLGGFKIWKLHFDTDIDRYTFRPTTPWRGQTGGAVKTVAFAGDAAAVAKERLTGLLRERTCSEPGHSTWSHSRSCGTSSEISNTQRSEGRPSREGLQVRADPRPFGVL